MAMEIFSIRGTVAGSLRKFRSSQSCGRVPRNSSLSIVHLCLTGETPHNRPPNPTPHTRPPYPTNIASLCTYVLFRDCIRSTLHYRISVFCALQADPPWGLCRLPDLVDQYILTRPPPKADMKWCLRNTPPDF